MPASNRDRLIIFSRFPRSGTTKTRMIPVMGADGAAELQRRMTEHILATAERLAQKQSVQIEVHFEDGDRDRMENWLGTVPVFQRQSRGNIGERMRHALSEAFLAGVDRAILIGADIPEITTDILKNAYRILDNNEVVLGPAADGGYYLIGARARSFDKISPSIFKEIEWGGRRVLEQTLNKAQAANATVELIETLTDVDRPANLPTWIGRSRNKSVSQSQPEFSVIMPALNEAKNIGKTLAVISGQPGIEILVIDGGSTDETTQIAAKHGATVYQTPPSKAGQMNAGAALARSDILLFLHADTILPHDFPHHIKQIINRSGVSAGAFRLGIGAPGGRLRFIEAVANFRSRFLNMPYGDQGIFMTAEMFGTIGGYPDQLIMEDFELIRRLKKHGKIAIAPEAVSTSPRRWLNMGVLRTWLINQSIVIAYLAGVSPHRLAHWYRREKGRIASVSNIKQGK